MSETPRTDAACKRAGELAAEVNIGVLGMYGALVESMQAMERELLAAQRKVAEQEALLMWVLWHTQGGSSIVGHRMRKYLGVGEYAHLTEAQVALAKTAGD